ncbi:MAG: pre-peptidase C-terminal domain-containing protein [Hormoscilla sp. SP5CHS1]|nr:pre-peptidase C-terminal domain-containing protein [Hormoscilla sp. SP12CHS1]MBC6456148.1 pre-peptidase C-terminal domain-containing protein [Hormoscilla sp. SP5CHS1]MBC6474113.1 pre-peptidase C-terminal domain-containing protein [Hormoscilla sp. GM102CHS1]
MASGTIDSIAELDTYTFNGTAGDSIVFQMRGTSGGVDPRIQIYRPDGTLLDSVASDNFAQRNIVLEQDGTYTVLINDNGVNEAGDYSISLQRT